MKTVKKTKCLGLLLASILAFASVTAWAAEENKNFNSTTTGSGQRFTTTVTQKTEGELKPEDMRQVSMLGSRILTHANNAARFMALQQADKAKTELEQAQKLAGVIRQLLPVTVVNTTVKDAKGNEVYHYEDRVQNDRIPIYEGLINVSVVQPIVEAKKEQAALKGLQLADADLIHTSVLLDLDYAEGKITQALAALGQPDTAQTHLAQIAAVGVQFDTRKEDHPLVQVQAALRLAEQQVREQKFDGAKANLQMARVELEAYRALLGDEGSKDAGDLEKEIENLQQKVREPGAADSIRGFWNRVTGWFKPQPGQAQQTTSDQRTAGLDKKK